MPDTTPSSQIDRSEQIEYWLRRAEQEAIAAIRAPDTAASESHNAMAEAYSAMATNLMDDPPPR